MLMKMTENILMDIQFEYPFIIKCVVTDYNNDKLNGSVVSVTANYKENVINLISCFVVPYNKDYVSMLNDFFGFLSKEVVSIIYKKLADGERIANLVGIIDDIIKSKMSPKDNQILSETFSLYSEVNKYARSRGFISFNEFVNENNTYELNEVIKNFYNKGKENDSDK